MSSRSSSIILALAASLSANAAIISVYLSPPSHQSSSFSGITTETFNSLSPGNYSTSYASAIGTYQLSTSARFQIVAADQYGGASGSRYMAIGAQSSSATPVELDLLAPQRYFGFWWSAGDAKNGISFYSGSTLIARFVTADIVDLLSPKSGKIKALDGNFYDNSLYYGNPNTPLGRNQSEPYAYVNFVASGSSFDRIVLDNSGTTGTGFESDNHSVFSSRPTVPLDHVFVTTVSSATPEPATATLASIALLGLGGWTRLRRKARASR